MSGMRNPMTTINQLPEKRSKASESAGSSDETIDALLARNPILWRGCDMSGRGDHGQSTGYSQLDDILPGRGWPRNAIVEIVSRQWGMGELQLLVPLMREVVRQGKWILWISPPYLLNSPALLQAGIDPEQVLVINLDTSCKDALWSMEKALQADSCGLVLAWQNWLPDKVVRRLQLAAEAGGTLGILFQHRISKYSQSSLRMEIKGRKGKPRCRAAMRSANEAPRRDANGGSLKHMHGASIENVDGVSLKQSGISGQTEIVVLKARGNFRPLSVQLNLYQETLPLRYPAQGESA